jgi:hypothetical protein
MGHARRVTHERARRPVREAVHDAYGTPTPPLTHESASALAEKLGIPGRFAVGVV